MESAASCITSSAAANHQGLLIYRLSPSFKKIAHNHMFVKHFFEKNPVFFSPPSGTCKSASMRGTRSALCRRIHAERRLRSSSPGPRREKQRFRDREYFVLKNYQLPEISSSKEVWRYVTNRRRGEKMVGVRGFEPPTFASRTQRSRPDWATPRQR